VVCGIMAYYTFLKDAKLWALASRRADDLAIVPANPTAPPLTRAA
jgi:hypothetical protein